MNKFLIVSIAFLGMIFASGHVNAEECAATVNCPGKVIIELDSGASDPDFLFRSEQVGNFYLEDTNTGRRATFTFKEPTRVVISQDEPSGWNLVDISCRHEQGNARTSEANERLTVDVELDDVIKCTFVNRKIATATPVATATSVSTSTAVPAATSVPFQGPSAADIAALEQANATKALAEAVRNQPAPSVNQNVIVEAPRLPERRITAPNTGDGGLIR